MNAEFWRGRRVFLTGHTGFKGSWLALWLQQLGAEVAGYALAATPQPNLFELARVGEGMRSRIADIRHAETLRHALHDFAPEIVFHLAAQPLVRLSYEQPIETYATNVMGTVHLLDAARSQSSVRAVLVVTSDKCYENRGMTRAFCEGDALGGHDPYSNSKACAELVSAAYRDSYLRAAGVALATVRAGNVIGGGDWAADRLIPDILAAMQNGTALVLRNPHATRPWQHVLEPLAGYLMLAEKLHTHGEHFAGAWNFGPAAQDVLSVETIVQKLQQATGIMLQYTTPDAPQRYEASTLALDSSKAGEQLHWTPRWPLDIALQKNAEWAQAYWRGADMRAVTLQQLAEYEATIPNHQNNPHAT